MAVVVYTDGTVSEPILLTQHIFVGKVRMTAALNRDLLLFLLQMLFSHYFIIRYKYDNSATKWLCESKTCKCVLGFFRSPFDPPHVNYYYCRCC